MGLLEVLGDALEDLAAVPPFREFRGADGVAVVVSVEPSTVLRLGDLLLLAAALHVPAVIAVQNS